jgi:hypothetical protein
MIEHEAIQPLRKSIKPSRRDDAQCPDCGGRMARRAKQCRDCRNPRFEIEQPDDPSYRLIQLTKGKVCEVSTQDFAEYNQWRWAAAKRRNGRFYAVRGEWVDGKLVNLQMHRCILGVTDPKIKVDHADPELTLNNRRENIRLATNGQNQQNKRSFRNMSGYKGVSRVTYKSGDKRVFAGWRGEITHNCKKYASKAYKEPADAARAYDRLAVKHFREFAYINFPEDRGRYEEELQRSYPQAEEDTAWVADQ